MKETNKTINHSGSVQKYIDFTLPEYNAIPDVGLLLDQTARLVNSYIDALGDNLLTGSMISNYVKHQIIARPIKKLYYREQIASLIFIAVAKTVLSLEDITLLLEIRRAEYTPEAAYDMFCRHFEAALSNRFKTAFMHGQSIPDDNASAAALHTSAWQVKTDAASPSGNVHGSFNTYLLDSLINAVVECIHLRSLIEQTGSRQA